MNRESLLEAVEFAAKVIHPRSTLPVIECVQIISRDGSAAITGTNLDLYARFTIPCDTEFSACVPAKRLMRVLGSIASGEIRITPGDEKLTIGGAVFLTRPVEEFPVFPSITGQYFTIPREAIRRTISPSGTASDFIRQSVHLEDGCVVGCDTRRIHMIRVDGAQATATIPSAAAKMLAGMDGSMLCDGRHFYAKGEDCELAGKLIDGNYPNWRNVSPPRIESIDVPELFAESIRRTALCSESGLCEKVSFENGEVASENYSEPSGLSAAFKFQANPRYLLEALKDAGEGAQLKIDTDGRMLAVTNDGFTALVALFSQTK